MAREMEWNSGGWTQFLGRNGYFKCKGFNFNRVISSDPGWAEDAVRIYPITAKGLLARCFIEVPVKELREFVKYLEAEAKSRRK